MRVLVTLEHRFLRSLDGTVWTQSSYAYDFWQRYLAVFDEVCVVARVQSVELPPEGHVPVNGPGVIFASVPYYVGPYQYLRQRSAVHKVLYQTLQHDDVVIMRVASQLANCLFPRLCREAKPYGLEVVGDPWDVFAPGAVTHSLRPILRRHFTRQLKQQCLRASAVAYVTERALQSRYPVASGAYSASYSSVELPESAFLTPPTEEMENRRLMSDFPEIVRENAAAKTSVRLVFVGSLEQMYKAPDILLAAIAQCLRSGINLELTILGDGRYRVLLERQAQRLGISDRVRFRGQVDAQAVRDQYDRADLFVLPSRTEGLPRAMIEAMARSLPCIGSSAGGIPELLPADDVVPPDDVEALAARVREVVLDPNRRHQMAVRNAERARDFHKDVLAARRTTFYRYLCERTQDWIERSRVA